VRMPQLYGLPKLGSLWPQQWCYGIGSITRKPRGGPRISRRIIASRKPDVDASNVAMSALRSSFLAAARVAAA